MNVRVSSGSPYLPRPSLSLSFPTVIDSSLQSLTAAHQHLLRSEETERVARVSKDGAVSVPSLLTTKESGGHKCSGARFFFCRHVCCFPLIHRVCFCSEVLLPLYGLWSRGTSYYATHVGTTVCCYGDCQGSLSIIGVYPRQEQGYPLSIRTRFNLPHSLDHTSRSAHSPGDKGRTQCSARHLARM